VYRVSPALTAAIVASKTAAGGRKSGSPTHKDVTVSPAASISLTKENISTVLLGLTSATMGFRRDRGVDDDDDAVEDVSLLAIFSVVENNIDDDSCLL
jgi:hypothetical protein